MENNLIARSSIVVDAPKEKVWEALVDPKAIKEYMFGANVTTKWREGDPITWEGQFDGKRYKDKGEIIKFEPDRTLKYTHFSPLSGEPDRPENYHTVTIELSPDENKTLITLTQDNNRSEEARKHSEKNWKKMLTGLQDYIEH